MKNFGWYEDDSILQDCIVDEISSIDKRFEQILRHPERIRIQEVEQLGRETNNAVRFIVLRRSENSISRKRLRKRLLPKRIMGTPTTLSKEVMQDIQLLRDASYRRLRDKTTDMKEKGVSEMIYVQALYRIRIATTFPYLACAKLQDSFGGGRGEMQETLEVSDSLDFYI